MVATVITEALSSMMGWLENGLDVHVSKDVEGMEGKSVVLVSNDALKTPLASSMKALRSCTHASKASTLTVQEQRDNARRSTDGLAKIKKRMPKVKFYRKYVAITSKIAKAGLVRETCTMDVKAQARVDSDLALWKEWADNDELKELLPRPLLEPVILANKRALRRLQEAPAIRAAPSVI